MPHSLHTLFFTLCFLLPMQAFAQERGDKLDGHSETREQACREQAEREVMARVSAELQAAEENVRQNVKEAWAALDPKLQACVDLDDAEAKMDCTAEAKEFIVWASRGLHGSLTPNMKGVEWVDTSCGALDVAVEPQKRRVNLGEYIEAAQARVLKLYQLACDGGAMAGCQELGWMYGLGRNGTPPQDWTRAAELYRLACDGGYLEGCSSLGSRYLMGQGVNKNIARAMELFRQACDGGYPGACQNLGMAYSSDRYGPDQDNARAVEFYRQGCDGGYINSCTALGTMYANGTGIGKDGVRAMELYRQACDSGDSMGCSFIDQERARELLSTREERQVTDFVRVHKLPSGVPIYQFHYVGDVTLYEGVGQHLMPIYPVRVVIEREDGTKAVVSSKEQAVKLGFDPYWFEAASRPNGRVSSQDVTAYRLVEEPVTTPGL